MKKRTFLLAYFVLQLFAVQGQNRYVDSLTSWLNDHPQKDTLRVMTTHRLSYRLSEINTERAWQYAKESELLAKELGFEKGIALANINYAILETGEGNLKNSADYYMKAIAISERINFTRGMSISYNNIGENYLKLKQYDRSIEYTIKARDLNRSIKEQRGESINYEQLGNIYYEQKKFSQAYAYWNEGFKLAQTAQDLGLLSLYYINFGKYYISVENFNQGFINLKTADSIAQSRSELLTQILCCKAFAMGYDKLKNHSTAIQYLNKGIELSKNLGNKTEECDLFNLISLQYEKTGKSDSGIYYLRMHKQLSDTILSDKNFAHLAFIQTQYETKLIDKENAELRSIQKTQTKKLSVQNLLLIASAFIIILALISLILFYRSFQHKKKNLELEEQRKLSEYNQQIAEMEVKSLRSQMNPHFLFNSLNSIRNYIIKNEPQLASDYLANFASLMRKILDASQQSFISLDEEIDMLKLYLELERMRFPNKFSYSIILDEGLDSSNLNIPTMVIQPFIENAIWHGLLPKESLDGALKIHFKENASNQDEILCEIIDNGIGRAKSEAIKSQLKKHHSKGINITRERLKRLSKLDLSEPFEIIDLINQNGLAEGTKVVLHLPIL
jgi:tetratricopeptide (TPR) repeat protein